MNSVLRIILLLAIISLPHPSQGHYRRRYGGILMYYDLCPWKSCGCPFCVEVPTSTNTMKPLLTTSTMFPRQEEEPTTTTEAAYYYEEDPTTTTEVAYYYEEETTTPALETTIETTTEPMEEDTTTEEPNFEDPDPVTRPPRKTTTRPRTTTIISSSKTCTICICDTWSQRIHRWNPPPRNLHRFTDDSCVFCGQSWISSSLSRSQRLSTRRTRNTFNRRNGFLMGRWGSFSHSGGSGRGRGGQSGKWQYPQELPYSRLQRSFNRRGLFGNSFLFG